MVIKLMISSNGNWFFANNDGLLKLYKWSLYLSPKGIIRSVNYIHDKVIGKILILVIGLK